MKQLFFIHKEFLLGLILTMSLLWPLFFAPYFTHHDDVQVIRLHQMNKCIEDHQIPCRWVPDLGGLYGYPIFNYYAPLSYYYGELFYLLTHSFIISVKIMFVTAFLGSYLFMYLFARRFWGKLGGSLAAVFYAFAPYHALDFYVRGAMGEMWALMFFPLILWSISRLSRIKKITNLLLVALSLSFLILSHNLSTGLFLPVVVIFAGYEYFRNKSTKFVWLSLTALGLAISLAAFYFLPMVLEKNLVHVETTTYGYFGYTEHFKGLRKLFIERSWGWGASVREVPGGEVDGLSFQIGWVHLLGWIVSLITARILWKKNRSKSYLIILFSALTAAGVFMIHPRSEFIWKAIEPLKYVQFPWRFLMLIIFLISFLSGSVFLIINKHAKLIWVSLLVAVVVLNFSYFRPEKFIWTSDTQYLSGPNWDKQIKRSIFDYLPIYAKAPPGELATQRYEILTGDSEVFDFKEGTNWISFKTITKIHTIIRLSQYYFPNWKIFVDGKEIKFDYKNNTLGLMTFILGEGNHSVEARLYNTTVRSTSNVVTLAVAFLMLFLFIIQSEKVRKWITYYRKRVN